MIWRLPLAAPWPWSPRKTPWSRLHGYYLAQAANERLSIERNPRYQIIALEGSGEDIYYSTLYAVPSDGRMRPFCDHRHERHCGL